MKKFSLIVVLIALVLSACSQNQLPEAKQLTTNELRDIITSSPQFDAANHLIQDNNLYLDWENAKITNPANLYILIIPTQTTEYTLAAYYDSRNNIVLGTDIIKTKLDIDNTVEVNLVDVNSLYLAKYTFDKLGNKLSDEYGKLKNISNLSTAFTSYTNIDKSQLYRKNLIHTLNNDCNAEIQAVDSAYRYMLRKSADLAALVALGIVETEVAVGLCYTSGVWTGGYSCYLAGLALAAIEEQIADASVELDEAVDDLNNARADRDYCQSGRGGGGHGGGR